MSKLSLLSSLIAFSLLFQGCTSEKQEQKKIKNTTLKVNSNELTLTTLQNEKLLLEKTAEGFKLKNSKAKILILDIFATWCPPCQSEASVLANIQKKYAKDIKVIGVTIEENIPNEKLKTFKQNYSANYTLVNSSQNKQVITTLTEQLKLGKNFGIPLLAIFKDGKLVKYYQGVVEEEFIESDIKRALEI